MPWEVVGHEIRHRVRNPDDFRPDTFRTKAMEGVSGEGITDLMAQNVYMVLGKLKESIAKEEGHDPNSMVLQSVRFRTEIEQNGEWKPTGWTLEKAKKWWKEHKESKMVSPAIERRAFPFTETRVVDGDKPKIVGYAAVFDQLSEPLWGFREIVRRGAFAKTIKEADVRALWNHDTNHVLGRIKSGTLRLKEDEKGLAIEIDPPNTQWARDLMESIRRGDVDQMSFGFRTVSDRWQSENGATIRELLEVDLFDVSPVTFPAYPQTSVGVRSAQEVYESYLAVQASRFEDEIKTEARKQARVSRIRTLQEHYETL